MKNGNKVRCPSCSELVKVEEDTYVGDIIYCPECSVELEVVKLEPLKVREVKELIKDEDDEYGEDDDIEENFEEDEEYDKDEEEIDR